MDDAAEAARIAELHAPHDLAPSHDPGGWSVGLCVAVLAVAFVCLIINQYQRARMSQQERDAEDRESDRETNIW